MPVCRARWGSIERVEHYIVAAGFLRVRECLKAVILKKHASSISELATAAVVPRGDDEADGLTENDMSAYRRKIGRFRRDVLQATDCDLVWDAISISKRSREPLHHLRNFLLKPSDPEKLFSPGEDGGNQLCRLACGKGFDIANGFCQLFVDDDWISTLWADAPNIDHALQVIELVVALVGVWGAVDTISIQYTS